MRKLGLIEFTEVFYDNLDTLIISSELNVAENKNFYDEVIFKCFDIYQRDGNDYSVNDILKFFHVFLYAAFKHKFDVYKDDDEIKLH